VAPQLENRRASVAHRPIDLPAEAAQLGPHAVVIAGGHAPDDTVARWAYAVRSAAGPLPAVLYRRGAGSERLRAADSGLPPSPLSAQRQIFELIESRRLQGTGNGRSGAGTDTIARKRSSTG